jgi:hypothetical protein
VSIKLEVKGFRDIERALADLPRGTSKGVARRAMKKELAPIADTANAFWPGATDDVFRVTSRISPSQRGDSQAKRGRSVVNLYVGANYGPQGAPHAHLIEFGTGPRYTRGGAFRGSVAPQPMLQPAWDAHKNQLLEGLGARLWDEIRKTQARRAAKAARG